MTTYLSGADRLLGRRSVLILLDLGEANRAVADVFAVHLLPGAQEILRVLEGNETILGLS